MTNLMIRMVTLATCSVALISAFSVTPVVAAGGSDLGGGEANYSGMDHRSAYPPPSSHPKRSARPSGVQRKGALILADYIPETIAQPRVSQIVRAGAQGSLGVFL
jgi:hypothetical protein